MTATQYTLIAWLQYNLQHTRLYDCNITLGIHFRWPDCTTTHKAQTWLHCNTQGAHLDWPDCTTIHKAHTLTDLTALQHTRRTPWLTWLHYNTQGTHLDWPDCTTIHKAHTLTDLTALQYTRRTPWLTWLLDWPDCNTTHKTLCWPDCTTTNKAHDCTTTHKVHTLTDLTAIQQGIHLDCMTRESNCETHWIASQLSFSEPSCFQTIC